MPTDLKIDLTKSQAAFLALDCLYPAFIAGYGSGKSFTMGLRAVLDGMHSGSSVIALYEPDYSLIRTVALPNVERFLVEFGFTYKLNKQEHTIYTSSSGIGDFIFKSMDRIETFVGYEAYRSHIDELDTLSTNKAAEAWNKILGRTRQRPTGVDKQYRKYNDRTCKWDHVNKIAAYSTPEGFKFMYQKWVQQQDEEFKHVKGRTMDNPHLTDAYIDQMMKQYSGPMAKAYLEGEFVNLNSGTVYNAYDRLAHDSHESIREKEPLYIGMDFNVTNMSASIWVKRNGGEQWHAVAELSGLYDTPEMIRVIKERWQDKGHQIQCYPDASGKARHSSNAAVSDIALLRQAGFTVCAKSKNPDVRDRVAATNRAFGNGRLRVNQRQVPNIANCLEQQCYNKHGEPDKDGGQDHQNDATTYPIAYEFMINKPLYLVPVRWVS